MEQPRHSPGPENPDRSRPENAWPRTVMWIAIVALVLAASLAVFFSLRQMPREMAEGGRQALREIGEVARAFRAGTITTTFRSQIPEVEGETRLQVATLRGTEVFERRDEAKVFWGYLELPDVVVEVTAPVEYTYTLDLAGEWHFEQEGSRIRVLAPPLEFNTPAIDASAIHYEVSEGGLLRDTEAARQSLQQALTEMARQRARQNRALVLETARGKTEEFVETWLGGQFDDAADYAVEVRFADEGRAPRESSAPRTAGERSPE